MTTVIPPSPSPALPPPSGVTPNFNNPDSLREEGILSQVIGLSFVGTAFAIRCYARLALNKQHRQWIAEDWLLSLAFAALCAVSSSTLLMSANHGGAHQWNLTVQEVQNLYFSYYLGSIFYLSAILFTKMSILLMYLRLFVPRRWSFMWWIVWMVFYICTVFYTVAVFLRIFQCSPCKKVWIKNTPGTCINLPAQQLLTGVFNAVSDFVVLVIPFRSVWILKMSAKRKVGASLIFALGTATPVLSAYVLAVRLRESHGKDVSYSQSHIQLWATAELTTGVLCACLPMIPAVFRAVFRKKTANFQSGNNSNVSASRTIHTSANDTPWAGTSDEEYHAAVSRYDSDSGKGSDEGISQPVYQKEFESVDSEKAIIKTVKIEQFDR